MSLYSIVERLFPGLINSKMKLKAVRKTGVKVGNGTVFFDAGNIAVDTSRPELLEIGEYCKITGGTIILTHDYSRSVLRRVYGDVVAEARKTIIGNNVFIGMNAILLMGTQIGDNCIVGAGSVCHGIYPSDCVIAGNPAKVIMTLDEYYNKRKEKQIGEAQLLAREIRESKGSDPTIHEMGAFFPLYLERTEKALRENDLRTNLSGDDEREVIEAFLNSKPVFSSFDDFLKSCH